MKPEWKKYTGSDEQIAEIEFACSDQNGVVLKLSNGKQSRIFDYDDTCNVVSYSFTHYLICQPHPYADMICQWTRTGQPVYWRIKGTKCPPESDGITCGIAGDLTLIAEVIDSDQYEVSFTPFEEEV